ncbi:hypothetical protein DMENIID0001_056970 [Sergentomyia squamirostris]
MASDCVDLAIIQDEELLRRMWQQTEDFARKKEIRAHMYKLRENRLRDFYSGEMDSSITTGIGKGLLGTSHGDSLADQSFQSFKAKEIRDSESPTRDFDGMIPDTSGWNVVTSSEVANDGKTHLTQSVATTAGAKDMPGGKTVFSGRNEQMSSVTQDGDENNFTKTAGHTSNTLLEETSVVDHENSGSTERKSTSVSSSSRVMKSHHISSGDHAIRDHQSVSDEFNELIGSTQNKPSFSITSEHSEQKNTSSGQVSECKTKTTVSEAETLMKQKEVERLAALPGEIVSRKIEYPDANTKMITETKALTDGTIVTTTKYETRSASTQMWTSNSNKKESTSSRSRTEEHGSKQRIEYIHDDDQTDKKTSNVMLTDDSQDVQSTDIKSSQETQQKTSQDTNVQSIKSTEKSYKTSQIDKETKQDQNIISEVTLEIKPKTDVSSKQYIHHQDHFSKRVSVEVDAAHDAFARSLRSISPDSAAPRSLTISQTTLRNQEKAHARRSPSRETESSKISSATVIKSKSDLTTHDYQRSTISSERRQVKSTTKETDTVDNYEKITDNRIPVREVSPVRRPTQSTITKKDTSKIVTDLDGDETTQTISSKENVKTTTENFIKHESTFSHQVTDTESVPKKTKKQEDQVTQKTTKKSEKSKAHPTAQPRKTSTGKKETEEVTEVVEVSESKSKKHKLTRRETYEERCRQILGMMKGAEGEETVAVENKDTVDFVQDQNTPKPTKGKGVGKKTKSSNDILSSPDRRSSTKDAKISQDKSPVRAPKDHSDKETKPQDKNVERKTSTGKKSTIQSETVTKTIKHETKIIVESSQPSKSVTRKETKDDDSSKKDVRKKSTTEEKSPVRKSSVKSVEPKQYVSSKKLQENQSTKKISKKSVHSDYSSDADDSEKEVLQKDKTNVTEKSRRVNKLPVTERKESAPVYTSSRNEKEAVQKIARSTSENVFTSTTRKRSKGDIPQIRESKSPEKSMKSDSKRPTKCITTKTINLSAANTETTKNVTDVDVIVDIQQAKSSREPTPNRIIPVPVSPEEDTGKPRYPDTVSEPEDERRQSKIRNIPIFEEETSDYIGCSITEVPDEESSFSVTRTVDVHTSSEEISKHFEVKDEEHLVDDKCRLSVSEKVTKFITTAEEVKKSKTSAPFSPDRERDESLATVPENDECLLSVTDKVSKFITSAEEVKKPKTSAPFQPVSPSSLPSDLITDESQLSVTEKVTKFRTRVEKLAESTPHRSPELVAKVNRQVSKAKRQSLDKTVEEEFGDFDEKPHHSIGNNVKSRYSPKEKSPLRTCSPVTLQSTEIVKRARAVFEQNKSKAPASIINRPSVWEGKRMTKLTDIGIKPSKPEEINVEEVQEGFFLTKPDHRGTPHELDRAFQSSAEKIPVDPIPSYMKDAVSSRKKIFEKKISSSRLEAEKIGKKIIQNVERKISKPSNGYDDAQPVVEEVCMKKEAYVTTDRDKEKTPTRDLVGATRSHFEKRDSVPSYMSPTLSSLEHRNRGRKDSTDRTSRKTSVERKDEELVDGNPRSNVKFGVALKRTDSETSTKSRRKSSCPEIPHVEEIFDLELLERMLETVVGYEQRRRIRAQIRIVKKEAEGKAVKYPEEQTNLTTTSRKTTWKTNESFSISRENGQKEENEQFSSGPKSLPNLRQTRKIVPESDDKPIWATKNILKKASETNRTQSTRKFVTDTKNQRVKTTIITSKTEPTDSVTSSYGIGPTDDNGQPLFGLKALKKKIPSAGDSKTKITGTIIQESYHSVNGSEPMGHRSVTTYSTDSIDGPKITSYREDKSPKVVRRGSVKELSEKFIMKEIANAYDKSPSQNYPKAGLILRTQTSREDRHSSSSNKF